MNSNAISLALIGAGPSALYVLQRILKGNTAVHSLDIFERKKQLGAGMPYSPEGASKEHITNVSGNEIPALPQALEDWVKEQDEAMLQSFGIDRNRFHEYKVVPRLLFGKYLEAQFKLLIDRAIAAGIRINIHTSANVTDIRDEASGNQVAVQWNEKEWKRFDKVIICSGHFWPHTHEGKVKGYYDSPYPPQKLRQTIEYPVALRGSSLTAIDAMRTLAHENGNFVNEGTHRIRYRLNKGSEGFRITMYSRSGLLPAVRFHLEDTQLNRDDTMSEEEVSAFRNANGGFLPLDEVFERSFKQGLRKSNPGFYEQVKNMTMEEFVDRVMTYREEKEPFELLKQEYAEAAESIKQHESVHWKELLATLSFTLNYPAKYFSGEDMKRLHDTLLPLISIVIAFVPQSSVEEMLALYEVGLLQIISVGEDCEVKPRKEGGAVITYERNGEIVKEEYNLFVDCIGQPHLSMEQLPYPSLVKQAVVSEAKVRFKDPQEGFALHQKGDDKIVPKGNCCFLTLAGIAINDAFQVVNEHGDANNRIFMMAVPFMGGYNPDYSGLDFCEKAADLIVSEIEKMVVVTLAS